MGWLHDQVVQSLHGLASKAKKLESEIEQNKKLKTFETVVDTMYDGLNSPDFNAPPELEGNSEHTVTMMVVAIILVLVVMVLIGLAIDKYGHIDCMKGRPKFWAIAMLMCSYLLLLPGLTQPLFSFNIVINVVGQRKYVAG